MADFDDTTAYPVFAATTGKRDAIRELLRFVDLAPALNDIIYRLNNTDVTGWTDGATVYDPKDSFEST